MTRRVSRNIHSWTSFARQALQLRHDIASDVEDQIVCGINNEPAQKHLLAEPNLDFKKAVELAQALETAESSAKQLTHGSSKPAMSSQDITAVHKTAPAPSHVSKEQKCYCKRQTPMTDSNDYSMPTLRPSA